MASEEDEDDKAAEQFFGRLRRMKTSTELADRVASFLWDDVTDRRGWKQQADQFDWEVRNEILDKWVKIIRREIKRTP